MFRCKIRLFIVSIIFIGLYSCKSSKKSSSSSKKHTTTTSSSKINPAAEKVIKTARSYDGTKYKYGGNTKSGMDCSGLMCESFKSVDVMLPRTSSAQSSYGKRIYVGEIQPGDLIFFATGNDKKKINHVGLVTEISKEKDIQFIHATLKRGVCEDWLSNPYYKPRYIKAIRIFN